MAALITTLIDKQDSNEIVRNAVAAILALEEANQRALAIAASKDPDLWEFNVFLERSNPWEDSEMPLVNVMFSNDTMDNKGSNQVSERCAKGQFFVDCYGSVLASSAEHGDVLSSKDSDRVARLVRNILMSDVYTYLGLRSIVQSRLVSRREKFQPDIRNEAYKNVVGTRLTLDVQYTELGPQAVYQNIEQIFTQVTLSDSGQVLAEVLVDNSTP